MHFLLLLSWFAVFTSQRQTTSATEFGRRITVTGMAMHAKAGAVVITDSGPYYLDGIGKWDDEHYGKKVEVRGRLMLVKNDPAKGPQIQEIAGTTRFIKKPKWKLVKD